MEAYRGNLYIIDLGCNIGSIQSGIRPCVVLSNNENNVYSPTVNVAPLTTSHLKNPNFPMHCVLKREKYFFLKEDSFVLLEQITTVNKSQIKQFLGSVSSDDLNMIYYCLDVQMGREGK